MPDVFGMDVGNGFGCVAIFANNGNEPESAMPKDYVDGFPTAVFITSEGQVLLGEEARKNNERYRGRAVRCAKMHMEQGNTIHLEGDGVEEVSSDKVFSTISAELLHMANEQRNNAGASKVRELVLTYPTAFENNKQLLNRMEDAVNVVKFNDDECYKVIGRLPEPAAAAFDYLNYMCNHPEPTLRITQEQFTAVVYDLGHGTLDTALVTANAQNGEYKVHATGATEEHCAGEAIDSLIYGELLNKIRQHLNNPTYEPVNANARERLRQFAVDCKHTLSNEESWEKEFFVGDEEIALSMNINEFEDNVAPLLERSKAAFVDMLNEAYRLNIVPDCVVLTGGSTRIRYVHKMIAETLKKNNLSIPMVPHRPGTAVAYGAALYGHLLQQRMAGSTVKQLEQSVEYSFGVKVPSPRGGYEARYIINADASYPASSKPIRLRAESDGVVRVIVCRSKSRGNADPTNAWEIIRFGFIIGVNAECSAVLKLKENHDIEVEVTLPNGKHEVRTTRNATA